MIVSNFYSCRYFELFNIFFFKVKQSLFEHSCRPGTILIWHLFSLWEIQKLKTWGKVFRSSESSYVSKNPTNSNNFWKVQRASGFVTGYTEPVHYLRKRLWLCTINGMKRIPVRKFTSNDHLTITFWKEPILWKEKN